jgi:hypothetical protein
MYIFSCIDIKSCYVFWAIISWIEQIEVHVYIMHHY